MDIELRRKLDFERDYECQCVFFPNLKRNYTL